MDPLPVTFKEGPELSYINLCTIQSPHGIRIEKKNYINDTILAKWFSEATERVNYAPTPFKEDSTFEISQKQTPPDTPNELYHLEDHYLEKPSAHM